MFLTHKTVIINIRRMRSYINCWATITFYHQQSKEVFYEYGERFNASINTDFWCFPFIA